MIGGMLRRSIRAMDGGLSKNGCLLRTMLVGLFFAPHTAIYTSLQLQRMMGMSTTLSVRSMHLLTATKRERGTSSSVRSSSTVSSIATPEENMLHVSQAVETRKHKVIQGLQDKGWIVVDDFLGKDVCKVYRDEAAGFYARKEMTISKSTRWDSDTQSVITYDKHNVYATQLNGGEMYYVSPRLHEYVVSLIKSMVPAISDAFPDASLSPTMASNKLAVCTGDGSYYDKHYDNHGAEDLRKLTVLYYLNPSWREELGGCFRIYKRSKDTNMVPEMIHGIQGIRHGEDIIYDVEPKGDRLLVFWSDRLVHSVQPSQAPQGIEDHRWALTVWLTTTHASFIVNDNDVMEHFSELQKGVQG